MRGELRFLSPFERNELREKKREFIEISGIHNVRGVSGILVFIFDEVESVKLKYSLKVEDLCK